MKRIPALLLAMAMLFCVCFSSAGAESEINFQEAPYTIHFPLITLGESPADLMLVENTLNQYLLEKINATVEMEAISIANLTNTYTLRAASGEKMDIVSMLPAYVQLLPMVSSNMLMDITDLIQEWGQGIIENAGVILDVGKVYGKQYFIPTYHDFYTAGAGLTFNSELVKKYDLVDEIQAISTLADLEPILALIKENEPNVIPYTAEIAGDYLVSLFGYDGLGDGLGVLDLSKGDELKVVNWFASDTFKSQCALMHDWFEKGYISKDAATTQDGGSTMVPAGAAFCYISTYAPNQDEGFNLDNPVVEWPISDVKPVLTTNTFLSTGHAIAARCERPDKVMQFLNLLYTDEYVCTLLRQGIEGIHYNRMENGLLSGISMDNGYYIMFGQFGDIKLEGIRDIFGENYPERVSEFVQKCYKSPAFGFVFDSTSVQTQVANCSAVWDEYYKGLASGSVDPEKVIPEFIAKLEKAGINDVIAEKQKQLDAWAALQ